MKAKCIKCKTIWEYEANEMKVELNGTGLIITLYCPKCHEQFYGYNPNELAFNMTPFLLIIKLNVRQSMIGNKYELLSLY